MVYEDGEISAAPNTIYWLLMPVSIGETDKIELLKRDILLIDCNYDIDDYSKLKEINNDNSSYFYNLDRIFAKYKDSEEIGIGKRLASYISSFNPSKSIIHTMILNETIKNIFLLEGLFYIEKNFNDKSKIVDGILELIKPIFSDQNKIRRSSVRINLYPLTKYKIEICSTAGQFITSHCFLKDISLSGIGIIFLDKIDIDNFTLKDTLQIKIFTPTSILKIPLGITVRKDAEKLELGIAYNVNDKQMIKEDTANYLTKIIYKWIKDIIDKKGKLV